MRVDDLESAMCAPSPRMHVFVSMALRQDVLR